MNIPPSGYFNRFDESKNYDKHLFRAGYVLQSAELNEVQDASIIRLKNVADALFKDGDVVRDAVVLVNAVDGNTVCQSGAVYLRGAVRGVPPKTFTIPTNRTVAVGVWLIETTITENEDPTLRDPASETRNYQEPGASRLQVNPVWGYDQDGTVDGEFFPIYYADNGHLRAKEAPPQLDSVSQAIARYDRDSTGSSYIVSGMKVSRLADLPNGTQVFNIQDGRARVNGFGISLNASRRLPYSAAPDLRFIDSEPHTSSTVDAQRVDLDRPPLNSISQIRVTLEKTSPMVHGTFTGAQDPLPDTSVTDIVEVKQGGTTYVKGVDYKLTAGRVDWSLSGAEPAPGSSYTAKYQYIATVEPTDVDDKGFTVTGAVVGTLILVNYDVKLPRIDRLCIDESGSFVWIQGVATDYNPVRPQVPSNLMALCQVVQTWNEDRYLIADGVRVVPMSDIETLSTRMDNITDLVAQQKLVSDIGTREASAKKGVFVDPFLDDAHRDIGQSQNAAVIGFALTLPIEGDAYPVSGDVLDPTTCSYTLESILEQTSRTGFMKINPYMAFSVPPSDVKLTPAVDRWTETQTVWLSPSTQKFIVDNSIRDAGHIRAFGTQLSGWPSFSNSSSNTALIDSRSSRIEHLRQIEVKFEASGFGPGELLESLVFDGIAVTAVEI